MSLLSGHEEKITDLAPAGFYIALRVGFSFPSEELNRLPETWIEFYTRSGFVVDDPMMKWVYANEGTTRWSDIDAPDPRNVLGAAVEYGLCFGVLVSFVEEGGSGKRSYGNFTRSDRQFTDEEVQSLHDLVRQMHVASGQQLALTAAEIQALSLQSQGLRLKQIAAELDISISAVKARLTNAKRKLGAQTPSQAASIAKSRGIL